MKSYEVLVASQRFHGSGALTYGHENPLQPGTIVIVPLQNQKVMGVVISEVQKPIFTTKPILEVLEVKPIPKELIDLTSWLKDYYPAPLGQLLTLFLPSSLSQKSRKKLINPKVEDPAKQPPLTMEQEQVVSDIWSSKQRMHLLHGETGTGKTRVYIELINKSFADHRNTLLLTPEIGLTSQLAETIESAFPGSARERWLRYCQRLSRAWCWP